MKVPYNCLEPAGNVVFAARGGKIRSFSLEDGAHISTWEHPDVEKAAAAAASAAAAKVGIEVSSGVPTPSTPANDEDGPPPKRQRVESAEEDKTEAVEEAKDADAMVIDSEPQKIGYQKRDRRKGNKQTRRNNRDGQQNNRGTAFARVPEYPVITIMTTTSNGSHLLAISGHDKSLWVFEHDGKGNLTELSQRYVARLTPSYTLALTHLKRQMPKRPCSVLICPDNETVLSADKFGDVYSLPLIPSETSESSDAAAQPKVASEAASAAPKPFTPEANSFTVHSKSNLRALQSQLREQQKSKRDVTKEQPTFEHTLQIGHVSMLTALTLASKGSRRYIITADRDEHIRVSRFMPHAHVIEGFCLGHANFISALTLPSLDVLVSGGGDSELFAWDWENGKVLSKFDVLGQVQQTDKDTTKVAVAQLLSATVTENGLQVPIVLVVCERFVNCVSDGDLIMAKSVSSVSAILVLRLAEDNILSHVQTISLPGNPLYVAPIVTGNSMTSILVTIDPAENDTAPNGIVSFRWTGAAFSSQDLGIQDAGVSEGEFDMSHEQVRKLLYNTEDLRKRGDDEQADEEEGDEQAQAEGEHASKEPMQEDAS
ncbi:WD repeat domain-containing protein [Colletotrichum orchidophilum]|uniref:WD repeat domain-containing protein n=1 Tax=Colletotrichum orchidophilum TaxID=1209926 RepID=A0A1G4BJD2_9PEZI|nr:WD repeat domain-containing protein [Colletotrichum orchidophilum]OHF01403.1 WD repeat domain-containing protein [Colletotrichum orchidophilum]